MAFRFVHTADIHLDSPLRSLALRDPQLAELIGNATRRAFVASVDLCLEEKADALLLAGDLYDGDQTSMKTARFLAEQVRRLDQAGVRVFIIRGNHDAESKITKELTFPGSVTVFGSRPAPILIEPENGGMPVAVHGLSFAKPKAPDSLLPHYSAPVDGAVNIGLMHTSLDGSPGHSAYAPCRVADLQRAGFRYWALGHIHKRAVIEGDCAIVMPGMPQGRDINEAGAKSVSLATVADDGTIRIEERVTSLAQFERVEADAGAAQDWRDLVGLIGRALDQARAAALSPQFVARLRLTGATPLAWQMRRDLDLLRAEAEDRAAAAGNCWIEQIELDCQPCLAAVGAGNSPVQELKRLIGDDIAGSEAYRAELLRIAEELRGQLPPECRHVLGADVENGIALLRALAEEGAEDVLARLDPRSAAA